ncbi:MAG TPA: hypothetical protein VL400_22020 [Polyangiaceae bacterium]|nr:hypothetical protein [Polyangiaceae bacterium]
MKSTILVGLSVIGLSALGFTTGCGDSGTTSTGTGGAGTGGTGTTTGVTVSSTGGGGTGGAQGDGNDTIETATQADVDATTGTQFYQGNLDPADSDVDFVAFDGLKGPVYIGTDAKPDTDPFADGYLDLVITVYDSNKNQIAQNDDPFPRTSQDSSLYTVLPADGKYYVKVEEFCEFSPGCPADYFTNISETAFAVYMVPVDTADNGNVAEATEPNDTLATAAPMEYEPTDTAGTYYLSVGIGDLNPTTDVDGIKFTIPSDVTVDAASRLDASFEFPPPGKDGDGSGTNPGLIQILDGATVVASLDMSAEKNDTSRASLFAPLTANKEYLLKIGNGPASNAPSADPFYFVLHGVGSGNPVEKNEVTNDIAATAEAVTEAAGTTSYFIEGDLGATDTGDYFSLNIEPGVLTVACGAQRSGSGVRGLTAAVTKTDGTTVLGTATETATTDLLIDQLDVSATGETKVLVKMTKTSQDATVTGTYYRCGYHFAPPTN